MFCVEGLGATRKHTKLPMLSEDLALLPIGLKLLAWFLSRKTKVLQTQKGYQRICIRLNWLHTGLQLVKDGAASAEKERNQLVLLQL
tara:strand:+ start:2371 stop:2631 length:261 start_codon:yes stop_codon:yes gene_type:complete